MGIQFFFKRGQPKIYFTPKEIKGFTLEWGPDYYNFLGREETLFCIKVFAGDDLITLPASSGYSEEDLSMIIKDCQLVSRSSSFEDAVAVIKESKYIELVS